MKKYLIFLFVSIFALGLCACNDNKEKEQAIYKLKEACAVINKDLPKELVGTTWQSVEVTDTAYVYHYTVEEDPGEDFISEFQTLKEEYKNNVLLSNLKENAEEDPNYKVLLEELKKSGLALVYTYTGEGTGKTTEIVITPEEVANIWCRALGLCAEPIGIHAQ